MEEFCDRREFLKTTFGLAAGLGLAPSVSSASTARCEMFKISLAQWSLHRSHFAVDPSEFGWSKFVETLLSDDYRSLVTGSEIDPLHFAKVAREFEIDAIEYVNTFFFDRARDEKYLEKMKKIADGEGVKGLVIMCDFEGNLGDPDAMQRAAAVEKHQKWVEAAKFLGCHSVRVNAHSDASLPADQQQKLAAEGLRSLCEFADQHDINVLVENHGGLSSDAGWLVGVMERVDHPRVGTLPDFGNFKISEEREYNRYQGVRELMPYAKAVSAKSYDFDEDGNETSIDFARMMKLVLAADYRGYVGIEYEGARLSEKEGIKATRDLLLRAGREIARQDGRG